MDKKNLFYTSFFLLLILYPVKAVEYPKANTLSLDEEAPSALFQFELGDAEVDLFLAGSWGISLLGTTGLFLKNGAPVQLLDAFPGMTPGYLFEQTPDITLSLWLMEQFFFELSYLGNFEDNQFLAGYENPEGDFFKHLYLGNRNVTLKPYPYLDIPETGNASLGAEALFQSANTEHNLLLRYDNNETAGKLFIGKNEIVEYRFAPALYMTGRYFKLPDAGVEGLTLFIEDPAGTLIASDLKKYRIADGNDAILDSVNGLVTLKNDSKGRLLVYYTKQGYGVGTDDPSLGAAALPSEDIAGNPDPDTPRRFYFDMGVCFGEDMAQRKIRVTEDCLLLWEPGSFSPFELLNSYLLPDELILDRWQYRIKVVYKSTSREKKDLPWPVQFQLVETEKRFFAYHTFNPGDSLRNLYPLPDPDHQLYGINRMSSPAYPDYDLLLTIFYPVTTYQLEPDLIPGSTRVIRNGIEETAFTVDYTTGILTFQTYIHPEDRIEVYYKRKQAALFNGDLLFAWGNHLQLDAKNSLDLALGIRWNLLPGVYSEIPFSRTGAITSSLAYAYTSDIFTFKAAGAISFANPDTTGKFRVWGMDGIVTQIDLEPGNCYPGTVPSLPLASGLTALNRGKLFYKDYRQTDFLGNTTLRPLDWNESLALPYSTGSKPGPYPVAGSAAGITGTSLVMDFTLENQPGWVGCQIPLTTETGDADLTGINALLVSYKTAGVTGDFQVYFQLGAIGEDLDMDNVLDAETSPSAPGFLFNDTAQGVNLLVGSSPDGAGNNILNTEDFNHNLRLDEENSGKIVSITGSSLAITPLVDEQWKLFSYTLTPAEQKKLSAVRALRILVVNNGAGSTSGKLVIDNIQLQGKTFFTSILNGNGDTESVQARELPESYSVSPAPQSIENQKVLEVDWDNLEPGESWELRKYLAHGLDLLYYKKMQVFLRIPVLNISTSPLLELNLVDVNNRGVKFSFQPAQSSAWSELTIDLKTQTVSLDNIIIPATVTIDQDYTTLSVFRISMSGSDSGLLYMDELFLKDTESTIGAGARLEGTVHYPGLLLNLGDIPLLGNLTFSEKAAVETAGFSSLYGSTASALLWNSLSTLSFDMLYSRLELDLAFYNQKTGLAFSAGHKLTIPAEAGFLSVSDTFHMSQNTGTQDEASGNTLARANALKVTFDALNTCTLSAETEINAALRVQNWKLEANNGINGIFTNLLALNLTAAAGIPDTAVTGGYFPAWIDAYKYILPVLQENLWERKSLFSLNPFLGGKPAGIDFKVNLESSAYAFQAASRTNANKITYSLALPLDWDDGKLLKIKLTPGYKRDLSFTGLVDTQGDFIQDFTVLFSGINTQAYLFTEIPFYELFAPASEESFKNANYHLNHTRYTPECSLSLTRNFGSNLYDLFLPSSLNLTLNKQMQKEEDLFSFKNNFTLTARTNALNLFGKYGVYPFFDFYTVDEYALTCSVNLLTEKNLPDQYNYTIINLLSFKGKGENNFSLENTLNFSNLILYDNKSKLAYTWYIHPPNGITLPFLNPELTKESYWSHNETLQLDLKNMETGAAYHTQTLLLSHITSFILPKTGFISGKLTIGLDTETLIPESEALWRLVIQGGIEARLQW